MFIDERYRNLNVQHIYVGFDSWLTSFLFGGRAVLPRCMKSFVLVTLSKKWSGKVMNLKFQVRAINVNEENVVNKNSGEEDAELLCSHSCIYCFN